jgi:hypothetical protein
LPETGLGKGYLSPTLYERKNNEKLQTFLLGVSKQKYCVTVVLQTVEQTR